MHNLIAWQIKFEWKGHYRKMYWYSDGSRLGFQYMTTISMILLSLSLIPMLPKALTKLRGEISDSHDTKVYPTNEDSTINIILTTLDIRWLKSTDLLVLFAYGMEQCLGFNAWSIYTSTNFFDQKFALIGFNASLSVFCSLIITVLFGKLIDKVCTQLIFENILDDEALYNVNITVMLQQLSHLLLTPILFIE